MTTLFTDDWPTRVHRAALALKALRPDPFTASAKERLAYRAARREVRELIEEVE